jgi:hypothetical protein
METEIVENMVDEYKMVRPLVLTSRRFRRNAGLGMKVWRSATCNFDYGTEIEHIEIGCPNYVLTDRGPVIERKKEDE